MRDWISMTSLNLIAIVDIARMRHDDLNHGGQVMIMQFNANRAFIIFFSKLRLPACQPASCSGMAGSVWLILLLKMIEQHNVTNMK